MNNDIQGAWEGSIKVAGIDIGILVTFSMGDVPAANIDIPQHGARDISLKNVSFEESVVHFELPAGPGVAVFHGLLIGGVIEGAFAQGGAAGTFSLDRYSDSSSADDGNELLMSLETSTGVIFGTFQTSGSFSFLYTKMPT